MDKKVREYQAIRRKLGQTKRRPKIQEVIGGIRIERWLREQELKALRVPLCTLDDVVGTDIDTEPIIFYPTSRPVFRKKSLRKS